jgi:poly-gamma-glutamate synthesis protein (capsule biosynthesis protein)
VKDKLFGIGMPVEISVKSSVKRRRKIPSINYLVIFLIAFLGAVTYFSGFEAFTKLGALVGLHKNFVRPYKQYSLEFGGSVSEELREKIEDIVDEMELDGQKRFEIVEEEADFTLDYSLAGDDSSGEEVYTSYLVPVGHFYWIKDGVKTSDLEGQVLVESENEPLVSSLLGNEAELKVTNSLIADLRKSEKIPALVDISELTYQMKLLTLDGKYFLDDQEAGIKYSLRLSGDEDADFLNKILGKRLQSIFLGSYDPDSVAKVNMTGVTALTRSLATKIDSSGNPAYPAERIGDFLKDADLTHVSNEVAFVPGCTPVAGVRFCSDPDYIKTFEKSGVDIVELTGNHDNDYGAAYNSSSIEMYKDRGWDYFGGGLNADDAAKILYKEVKGTKVAFIGYNYYDTMLGTGALATDSHAGANSYSESKMKSDIEEARKNADVVIVDFQFQECYSYPEGSGIYPPCYRALSSPDQSGTFRKAVDFGADIVIGTQAHQPQTYEIYKDKMIFYGLGNLFFDQIYWVGTRHGMVLTHYMYGGKLIQTKITTTNYGNDMQTYVSTGEERKLLLQLLSDAR